MSTTLLSTVVYFMISAFIGGYTFGFIFLSYFHLDRSHMFIAVIGVLGFIINFFITAGIIYGSDIFVAFPGSLIYLVEFAAFMAASYFGRRGRIAANRWRLKHELSKIGSRGRNIRK